MFEKDKTRQEKGEASIEADGDAADEVMMDVPEEVVGTELKPETLLVTNHNEGDPDVQRPKISAEEVAKMREEVEASMSGLQLNQNSSDSWQKLELLTSDYAHELCEQLRLILEPTLATKLRGDYRTGKRINMKKVCIRIEISRKIQ